MLLNNLLKTSKQLIRSKKRLDKIDIRCFSNISSNNIFDSNTKRLQKEVSIKLNESQKYDYLKDEIAYRVVDRVYDIKRRFPVVVDLGSYKGYVGKYLTNVCFNIFAILFL